jgi:hypothetical protein
VFEGNHDKKKIEGNPMKGEEGEWKKSLTEEGRGERLLAAAHACQKDLLRRSYGLSKCK